MKQRMSCATLDLPEGAEALLQNLRGKMAKYNGKIVQPRRCKGQWAIRVATKCEMLVNDSNLKPINEQSKA